MVEAFLHNFLQFGNEIFGVYVQMPVGEGLKGGYGGIQVDYYGPGI